jgi:peptidoglycan L-alanyl-D-glutamate endopeptidase CwlK
MCEEFLAECEAKMFPPIRVTHTLRTFTEQADLYAKGRKQTDAGWVVVDKGAIVTRAKPGESAHNYGAAFDICFVGKTPYPDDDALWEAVGMVGEGVGLVWGGRWKRLVDKPHFERKSWRSLKAVA